MFKGHSYRGRHRAPSKTAKNLAMISTAVVVPAFGMTGTAHAETPDWGPIIQCESGGVNVEHGGDPKGVSTASGYFQFLDSSWKAYGGLEFASRAILATQAEQQIVANRAFAQDGYSPWNASKSCWQGKMGKGVSVNIQPVKPKKAEPAPPKKLDRQKSVEVPKPQPKVVVPNEAVPTPNTEGEYTVKPGDTLSGIAAAHNVEGGWKALYDKNHNVVEQPDWIWPGEHINLH